MIGVYLNFIVSDWLFEIDGSCEGKAFCHEGFTRRGTCPILPSNPIVSLMTLSLKTKPNHGDGIVLPVFAQTCRLNEADQYYT